ncbi:MAG: HNH endonuclease [Desulfococcaceae bacterium]
MPIVDRNSFFDAEKWLSLLFSRYDSGGSVAHFLSRKIEYANRIRNDNWNLNLELNGSLLRFNVGQEYCIEIDGESVLILCLRQTLPKTATEETKSLYYKGYEKNTRRVKFGSLDEVPDCLAKVPNSVGVVIKENASKWLPLIDQSNSEFIDYAISNTRILPKMEGAHSVGAVDYLSSIVDRNLPNPSFALSSIYKNEWLVLKKLKKIPDQKLEELARLDQSQPRKITTSTSSYIRNPYIIERAKRLAGGKCHDCGQFAPFISKLTEEPFLEVHHVVPLSKGGEDSIDNVVALCPNCHRKRHYG